MEDHPLSLTIAIRLIEELGYKAMVRQKLIEQNKFNEAISIVLLGLDPETSGNDHRLDPILQLYPGIPVIGMTNHDLSSMDNRLDAVIRKPLKRKELSDMLANFLHQEHTFTPFDLSYLQKVSNGDPQRIAELLDIYIQEAPYTFAQMNQYLRQGQWGYLKDLAHKLQSNYRYLGANEMADMARELELVAQAGDQAGSLPELVSNLQNRSTIFSESLKRIKNRLI